MVIWNKTFTICVRNPSGQLSVIYLPVSHKNTNCLKACGRWWDSLTIRLSHPRILLLILILSYGPVNVQTYFVERKQQQRDLSFSTNDTILWGCLLPLLDMCYKCIYLSVSQANSRLERRLPVKIIPDD